VADYPTSTTNLRHPDRDPRTAWRRIGYAATTTLLTAMVVVAVVDNLTEVDVWGVSSDRVVATGGGYELEVKHPTVSRPALASPFDIIVRSDDGFEDTIDVAVSANFFEMWDFQNLYPSPSESTGEPDRVVMTFDTPDANEMRIFLDGRIQPAEQRGAEVWVAVLDDAGDEEVRVDFTMVVLP
jgi:hypothetical protein